MFDAVSLKSSKRASAPECVVFGVFGEKGAALPLDSASRARAAGLGVADDIAKALKRPEATGDVGSTVEVFSAAKGAPARVLVVGLGDKATFTASRLRDAVAGAARRLSVVKASTVAFELGGPLSSTDIDGYRSGLCTGEALGLLAWWCDEFRGKGTTAPKRPALAVVAEGPFADGVAFGLRLAESANLARTLSQTPPNVATPAWMAAQAKKVARLAGLSISVIEGDALEREKMEGLINVGKASENKPCLIRLEYAPKGASAKRPLVLVGKTMTYDTGGLSLKVNNGMVGMKRDKDGGCAVLGAMHAIGSFVRPKRRVIAYMPAAENSLSDEAYRPDDVLRFRNGVTAEVTNTDAEGRLVLADALCYTCEKDKPAAIVDLATLTGGVIVALGSTYAGMFCEDDALRDAVQQAADASGERVWRLPMHAEYREMMKSPVADIVNSNPNRKAHPIQGAAFLSYFVDEKIPWCHLDIAGVHVAEKNAGMYIEGPTGWGVRLLAELAENF
ncbi:MAG: leucyl aminopeptidase family protein [Planctomycetota bacterium]|nr:leucyl aminopeptidase family protein [Planctomycetota bacterium]